MKKIFYISGTTIPGGGPEHIYQLLKRLNKNEWEVILCTSRDGSYWEKFNSIGVKTYNLSLRILSPNTAYKLFMILRKEKPDLIHTHGKGPGLYGRIISRFLKIPSVHTFHGFHYKDIPVLTRWLHLIVENLLSLLTNQHIFVSTGEKKSARVLKFLGKENSTVINNGVDYEHIRNIPISRSEALKLCNSENWEPNKILGTISRLSPEKGVIILLEAFSKAIKKSPNIRLIIVGGYPEEHKNYFLKIKKIIDKENLSEYIRILEYRQDALEILKCFDFYISSSLSEGLPISILEAVASNVPTIATEITGNKDILPNSVFGILARPNSPESLFKAIIKMTQLNASELAIITHNALNRVKNNFSVKEMLNKTTLTYNQVLNKKTRLKSNCFN